jgi:hypothetical protein
MRFAFYLLLSLASFVSQAQAGKPTNAAPPSREVDLAWFFGALRKAERLEILEGLPHQYFEKEERAVELTKHKTLTISSESFYEQRLPCAEDLRRSLTEAFLLKALFVRPLIGQREMLKACGGFHADYGLRWSKGDTVLVAALICFGCHDVRLVGAEHELTTSMTGEGYEFLQTKLLPLRALRPPKHQLDKIRNIKPEQFKSAPPPKVEYKT